MTSWSASSGCWLPSRPTPGVRIGDVALLDDAEHHETLRATDRREHSHRGTVLEAYAATVAARAGEVALRVGDERLTFAELDARSARLAAVLVDAGHTGQRIGVALPRSADLVVALLAVLRAGAVYLPIDLEYPRTRIEHIVGDADPVRVLTDRDSVDRLPDGTPTLLLDDLARRLADEAPVDVALPTPAPEDPAYLTYTSGSTGRPKGVLVDHGALGNLHAHQRRTLHDPTAESLGRRVRMAHTTAVSFDAAWDPILWLVSGHELHLVDDDTRRDPEALVSLVRDAGIDAVETTPSYVQALLAEGLGDTGLTLALLGGEAVGPALWRELRAHPLDPGRQPLRPHRGVRRHRRRRPRRQRDPGARHARRRGRGLRARRALRPGPGRRPRRAVHRRDGLARGYLGRRA